MIFGKCIPRIIIFLFLASCIEMKGHLFVHGNIFGILKKLWRIKKMREFMSAFVKKLADDMKVNVMKAGRDDMANVKRQCQNVIRQSDSWDEEDAFPKLVLTAILYLGEMEKRDSKIRELKAQLKDCEKQYSKLCYERNVPYADVMQHKKECGFYPAEKHISYKTVKCLVQMGISKTQIAEHLGISRSTVYRKLKEAEEQGYTGECELNMRFNW